MSLYKMFTEMLIMKNLKDIRNAVEDIEKAIGTHYKLFGYEKQYYLKELLEAFFETKFEVDE